MGRIKGRHLHTLANALMAKVTFSSKLEDNKRLLNEMKVLQESKKEFNKLAGEITVKVKQIAQAEKEKEARHAAPAPAVQVA